MLQMASAEHTGLDDALLVSQDDGGRSHGSHGSHGRPLPVRASEEA